MQKLKNMWQFIKIGVPLAIIVFFLMRWAMPTMPFWMLAVYLGIILLISFLTTDSRTDEERAELRKAERENRAVSIVYQNYDLAKEIVFQEEFAHGISIEKIENDLRSFDN